MCDSSRRRRTLPTGPPAPLNSDLPAIREPLERMQRALHGAMQEILGPDALNIVLRRAESIAPASDTPIEPPDYPRDPDPGRLPPFGPLLRSLEAVYGEQVGRGLALRIGRASLRNGLSDFGLAGAAHDTAFKLLPLRKRIRTCLGSWAQMINENGGQTVHLVDGAGTLMWSVEHCPLCGHTQSDKPVCYLAVGVLQEALYWLSGGQVFRVEETACRGRGDPACRFQIDETPIS